MARISLLYFKSRTASKKNGNDADDTVLQARFMTDEQLRGVVFGYLPEHGMERYSKRIEIFAMNAVTVQRWDE